MCIRDRFSIIGYLQYFEVCCICILCIFWCKHRTESISFCSKYRESIFAVCWNFNGIRQRIRKDQGWPFCIIIFLSLIHILCIRDRPNIVAEIVAIQTALFILLWNLRLRLLLLSSRLYWYIFLCIFSLLWNPVNIVHCIIIFHFMDIILDEKQKCKLAKEIEFCN